MKLFEISSLMPPKVASYVIGRFFARYVEVLLKDIGMASDLIGVTVIFNEERPYVQVDFHNDMNRPTKPKVAKMKALAKEMNLNGSDFDLTCANTTVFSVDLDLAKPIDGGIDEEALRKGFLSFDIKQFTGDIRLNFE